MAEEKGAQKELSYEELKNAAIQLQQGYKELESKVKSLDMTLVRLQYLFKVIEFAGAFSSEFVDRCAEEIQAIITIPEEAVADDESEAAVGADS